MNMFVRGIMAMRDTIMLIMTILSISMEKNVHINRKSQSRKNINMKENALIIMINISIRGTTMIMQLTITKAITTKNINMEQNAHITMMSKTTRDMIMKGTITKATTMKDMITKAKITNRDKVLACKLQFYTLYVFIYLFS
jgi:hypothetical protein